VSLNKRTRGKTQFSTPFFFADTTSATGDGLSGVTSASPGLVMEYRRQGQSTWTSVTPQAGKTLGSYLSRGIVADGSLAGRYEVDFPDAAYASEAGVEWVELCVRGVANMLATTLMIELDAADYSDPVRLGLTSLPNVAQGNAGALPTGNASGQVTVATLTAGAIQSFWDALTSGLLTAGSIGKWILDNLNATVSSRATLAQIESSTVLAKDSTVAKQATLTQITDRIGAFAGSGVNTVLGFLRAIMRKDAGIDTPSDVGGTYTNTTDSIEAIRDRGDAAWTSGGGAGGVTNLTVEDRSITLE
jgi:hypothetical protein